MKTIQCIDCQAFFSGETPEEVMKEMHPHYTETHKEVMEAGDDEKRKQWFAEFQKRWETAEED